MRKNEFKINLSVCIPSLTTKTDYVTISMLNTLNMGSFSPALSVFFIRFFSAYFKTYIIANKLYGIAVSLFLSL